jgi:hypothetical protein
VIPPRKCPAQGRPLQCRNGPGRRPLAQRGSQSRGDQDVGRCAQSRYANEDRAQCKRRQYWGRRWHHELGQESTSRRHLRISCAKTRSTHKRSAIKACRIWCGANSVAQMHIENRTIRKLALPGALRRCIEGVLAVEERATVAGSTGYTRTPRPRLSSGFANEGFPIDDGVENSPALQVIGHGCVDHPVATREVICWVEPRRRSDRCRSGASNLY